MPNFTTKDLYDYAATKYPDRKLIQDLSRTPFESFWRSKGVNINGVKSDVIGFGPDVSTPWGPLPDVILAVECEFWKEFLQHLADQAATDRKHELEEEERRKEERRQYVAQHRLECLAREKEIQAVVFRKRNKRKHKVKRYH